MGEIFSLFLSVLTDTFGERYATTNYGFLYMTQGVGSVLGGPLAASLKGATGSWLPVFGIIVCFDLLTAALAFFVLKRMRSKATEDRGGQKWLSATPETERRTSGSTAALRNHMYRSVAFD